MNLLDLIILFLLLGALIQGYRRGLILQITSLVSYILAIWIAFQYTDEFARVISEWWSPPNSAGQGWMALLPVEKAIYSLITFFVLLIGTRLILSFLARLVNRVANLPILSAVNRSGGVLFGLAKVLLITFILVNVLNVIPWDTGQEEVKGSVLAGTVTGWTPDLTKELNQLFQGKVL